MEAWLREAVAARIGPGSEELDPAETFEALGLDSAAAVELTAELGEWLGRVLPETLLFDFATIAAVAAEVCPGREESAPAALGAVGPPPRKASGREPIAVVGLGCRLPGASAPEELWDLLREGGEAVTEIPAERWDVERYYEPEIATDGKMNSRHGGFIEDIDLFDARFFGISPFEAARMDPQQRILLEVAWHAIEDAGLTRARLEGSATAVCVGVATNDYGLLQLKSGERGGPFSGTGVAASIVSNRLSYVFDLRGPSLSVDTACSSSLTATHLACQSIWSGEAEMAIAGGVNLILVPEISVTMAQLGVLSSDGRCKAFDARADGLVRSEGAAVAVLKPLAAAREDGDRIYATVHGTAVNSDGRSNGMTSPSRFSQEDVLRRAYDRAELAPAGVQYVEAHGTGTMLGDPIEAEALAAVLGEGREEGDRVAIGSIKTNIGHAEAAAGIAGFVKAALAVHHRRIPASLHFESPNPQIRFDLLPLRVQTEFGEWPRPDRPLVAGVSSFGFGGTNAHAVLAEPGYA